MTSYPVQFAPLFQYPFAFRNFVARGGRGGAKSHTIAEALVVYVSQFGGRILCAREFQNSISESVHQLIKEKITALGLEPYFRITDTSISCKHNDGEFIFAGIRTNVQKIKSLQSVMICWVEEAAKVSKNSWEILLPSIREDGSIIIVSYNPELETDPTSLLWSEEGAPPRTMIVDVNFYDNPYFPRTLFEQMRHAYRVDPEGAAHIWGGGYRRNTDSQIFKGKYRVDNFVPVTDSPFYTENWDGPYDGLDFGFSSDPLAGIRAWIFKSKLYIEYESGDTGVDNQYIKSHIRKLGNDGRHPIIADSANPGQISYLNGETFYRDESKEMVTDPPFNVIGAEKGPGSVEDGINFIKSFDEVIIHSRCTRTEEEFRMYSYKKDKLSGLVTADIIDAWNHWIDALRYALSPVMKGEVSIFSVVSQLNKVRC